MSTTETTTAAAGFLADNREPAVRLDGYNRYVLPHPETGKETHLTRATTWSGAAKDAFGLNRWSRQMEAHGFAMRPDLLATVAADVSEYGPGNFRDRDCSRLDEAIAQAQEHAGSTQAATLGTVMHRFTELLDSTGEMPEVVPPPLDRDLVAYRDTMAASGFQPVAIERIVCVPDLGVAGTLDRILSRGSAYIGDLKTGRDLGYSWGEIAVQLALYAHATHIWEGDHWEPMPPVDRDRAVVMHVPVGQARCDLWWVDIAAGWWAANELCGPVRRWRNRRDLATPIDLTAQPPAAAPPAAQPQEAAPPAGPAPGATSLQGPAAAPAPAGRSAQDEERYRASAWISARLQAVAHHDRARLLVGLDWPDGAAPRPPWPTPIVDALARLLDRVEAEVGAPFPGRDPRSAANEVPEAPTASPEPPQPVPAWDVPEDGELATGDDVAALMAAWSFLTDDQRATANRWATDAKRYRRPFLESPATVRMLAISRAVYGCTAHLGDDERVRRALARVLGQWQDGWNLGAVLGSLDATQAGALADLADAYAAGNRDGIDPI